MTSEEFQERLRAAFEYDGEPYGRVFMIHAAEAEYGLGAAKFSGHLSLSDGFKACFLEAVELLNTHCRPLVKTPLSEFYPQLLPRLVNAWHTLCAAERTALSGYPRPAFTTLRNIFDDNVLTSAALQKITDFYRIEGIDPQDKSGKLDPIVIKKARKANEYAVRQVMTGPKSGLQPEVIEELSKLDQLYDLEVHGGRLSMADAVGYMKGTEPISIVPKFSNSSWALFMNRYAEVAWTLHRLLPTIQPPEGPMPDEWKNKWAIVDDSFEIGVRSLTKELGMKVGHAYADFINAKFPFNETSTFPL
jgi:hypothetical protein